MPLKFLCLFLSMVLLFTAGAPQLVIAQDIDFDGGGLEKTSKAKEKQYFVSPEPKDSKEISAKQEDVEKEDLEKEGAPRENTAKLNKTESSVRSAQISTAAKHHASEISAACPKNWEDQTCLRAASDTFLTTAAVYAEDLDKNGHKAEIENIKNHCAASTAATRLDDVPAYAMRSAFVECVNEIYDISERSHVKPDVDMYQLMVMSVLCLDKDQRCALMEDALKKRHEQ